MIVDKSNNENLYRCSKCGRLYYNRVKAAKCERTCQEWADPDTSSVFVQKLDEGFKMMEEMGE